MAQRVWRRQDDHCAHVRTQSSVLPVHVKPGLGLEIVHRVVLENGNANLERKRDCIGELLSETNVEGNEPSTGLSGDRIAKIHANVGTGIEGNETSGQAARC